MQSGPLTEGIALYRLNFMVVIVLTLIAIAILAMLMLMHRSGQQLPGELTNILSMIVGGLLTFLSHQTVKQSNLNAPDVQTLNVTQQPEANPSQDTNSKTDEDKQ